MTDPDQIRDSNHNLYLRDIQCTTDMYDRVDDSFSWTMTLSFAKTQDRMLDEKRVEIPLQIKGGARYEEIKDAFVQIFEALDEISVYGMDIN